MAKVKENVSEIRRTINREFVIQVTFTATRRRMLVGYAGLVKVVGELWAQHACEKAIKSQKQYPVIKCASAGAAIRFSPR